MGEYQDNSLGSRVFQRLREDILSGKYKEHDELRENTLGKELGKTVILVLHEINYAAFYSDYICAFKNGKIAKYGTVEEVIQKEVLSEIYQVDFEILNIKGKPLSVYY